MISESAYDSEPPDVTAVVAETKFELAGPAPESLLFLGGASKVTELLRLKGTVPALRAISSSPRCQCIASAALQGIFISLARIAHISGFNLIHMKIHISIRYLGQQLPVALHICVSRDELMEWGGLRSIIIPFVKH